MEVGVDDGWGGGFTNRSIRAVETNFRVNASPTGTGDIFPIGENFEITSTFGPRNLAQASGNYHYGVDMSLDGGSAGVGIQAIESGRVTRIINEVTGIDNDYGGYRVGIQNARGDVTYYMHMQGGSNNHVTFGQHVDAGQTIGNVGNSGLGQASRATMGAHLHLQVGAGRTNVNPLDYYPHLRVRRP